MGPVLVALTLLLSPTVGLEPFTVGLGAGALSAIGSLGFNRVWCQFQECCSTPWIRHNATQFQADFEANVFGQHLAGWVVTKALKSHFKQIGSSKDSSHESNKALVMSFHGYTGSGKNYVAKFVAEAMFSEGLRSQYVHFFVGTLHFPEESKADIYRLLVQDWIRGNVSNCPLQLFVFDEIDKTPAMVMNGVKPFIDTHEVIDGVDHRQAVYLFLSNTGGISIRNKVAQLWNQGVDRTKIKLKDLESEVRNGAFNEPGGLQDSELIYHHLVDYFVPFLPLGPEDVGKCAGVELEKQLNTSNIECFSIKELIDDVKGEMDFSFDEGGPAVSKTGCKRVGRKVEMIVEEIEEVLGAQQAGKYGAYLDFGNKTQCRYRENT